MKCVTFFYCCGVMMCGLDRIFRLEARIREGVELTIEHDVVC